MLEAMSAFGDLVVRAYRRVVPAKVQAKLDEDAVARFRKRYTYDQDGLATEHSAAFTRGARFEAAYRAGEITRSWGNSRVHWRAHVYLWAASLAAMVDGDFVECGVNRGGLARATIAYLDFARLNKRFFLLDTYDGIVERLLTPAEIAAGRTGGGYEPCLDDVVRTFGQFPFCIIVPGPVPDTLPKVDAEHIAFLSIDMNAAFPEQAALEWFWPRLSPGGVIVLDDYGWANHVEQKKAHDAFAIKVGVELLALPTGQGLIIKPR
jgi:O-methyltransferase